jgi:hypothetical protein
MRGSIREFPHELFPREKNAHHFTVYIAFNGGVFQVESTLVGERNKEILHFVSTCLQVNCMQLNVNLLASKMEAYNWSLSDQL